MTMQVRKAVFPAAGLGTRFLPATKAVPKEMLAVVDKPVVQYGVEEALAAGCTDIIVVTSRGKSVMEDHFDTSFELEQSLEKRGKTELLEQVRHIASLAEVAYVRQKEAKGLGHAVLMAADVVGDEPFAVILPDDIVEADVPCIKQMIDAYRQTGSSVLGIQKVEGEAISAYGVLKASPVENNDRLVEVHDLVEKPKLQDAPSDLAIIGRYVLTPRVFEMLRSIKPGAGGELQLTDGIKALLKHEKVYGYRFEGKRHDVGDKLGMLKATVEFGLKHPKLGSDFRQYLKQLAL